MNADDPHFICNDSDQFAATDDMADYFISHAAELLARDRLAATKAEVRQLAASTVRHTTSVRQPTQGAI